ncbi:hypothetical protein BZA77DRAFT_297201 [Pyronema omphalodes]|nr:hypothetical protein BZA77DRAFT_297201 [Pyronema omphalodes]
MSSFAPSLPSLPSYPRHLAPSREASPVPFPQAKKQRPSYASNPYPPREYSYSHPLTPSATDSDDDDQLMSQSVYSDREYRTSLVGSRKRGYSEDSSDDYARPQRTEPERGGKRRIIDVVGGTLGGVLRGAWEMFRPRIPFMSSNSNSTPAPTPSPIPESIPQQPLSIPTQIPYQQTYHQVLDDAPSFAGQRRNTTGTWDGYKPWAASAPASAPSSFPASTASAPLYVDTQRAAPSATEAGMSARWVLVSPTEAQPRRHTRSVSSPTARRRTVIPKRKGLRPPRTPPVGGQPFGAAPSKKQRSQGSVKGDDDLEMDDDMRRFNERLKAMIREGKEALGATVEVVYDEDDVDMGDY